ncbi:hypothetical protein PGT21_031678 [Puccinia graminis f. sp. tritici]|uniref:Uncharacterized protein n=1 Tax=Puccinia graminis f. sp. tritici TaxID=56615 RepID=A0A5B0PIB9_PUCGR|nr:hypothetical protein PGT21_031678 [Puccinia graminis f. sp. tritici]
MFLMDRVRLDGLTTHIAEEGKKQEAGRKNAKQGFREQSILLIYPRLPTFDSQLGSGWPESQNDTHSEHPASSNSMRMFVQGEREKALKCISNAQFELNGKGQL